MQIIKNRQIVNSQWQLEPIDVDQSTILADVVHSKLVSLQTWLKIRSHLKNDNKRIGLYLDPGDEISIISDSLCILPVIALIFDDIAEGRGYSQAAELREDYHYTGEIRAIGASPDNLSLMERCGIDAFQLASTEDLELALSYFSNIETVYPYN